MKRFLQLVLLFFTISVSVYAEVVTIAVFDGAKPLSFIDENGSATGIFPDLLRYIFKEDEVTFITDISFQEAYNLVQAGTIDVVPAFMKTEERSELFDFNEEVVMMVWSQLFIRQNDNVESVLELGNERIALMRADQNGKNFIQFMKSFDIPFNAVYYDTFAEMAEAVLAAEVRGMVAFASFGITEQRVKGSNVIFAPQQLMFGVRKDGPVWILDEVDAALKEMKDDPDSEYYQIMEYWLQSRKTVEVLPRWAVFFLIIILLALIIIISFNYLLRVRVRKIRNNLFESEAKYLRLFQTAKDMIAVFEILPENKYRFVDVNDSFCETSGYRKEEIFAMAMEDFIIPEHWGILKASLEELEQHGEAVEEYTIQKKDGSRIPIQTSSKVFETPKGYFFLSVIRDLSHQEEFDTALRAVQQKYTTIAEYNFDWEYWLAEDGSYVYISPSCMKISGYDVEALQKEPQLLNSIIHPDDADHWKAHQCSGQGESEDPDGFEMRIIRKDGTHRWVQHQCRRIYSVEGKNLGIRGNLRDISKSKKLEEQLSRKERLESLGLLAGGIAHDFNNILAIIKGFSDIGMRQNKPGRKPYSLFENIFNASERGEALTSQILDFSRSRSVEQHPVQASAAVREVLEQVNSRFPENIKIEFKSTTNSFFLGNEGQMHRVLLNLFTNSRLAMPDGGLLKITLRELDQEEIPRLLPDADYKRCMEIRIKDSGIGMDEALQKRIFDPFFTTRRPEEGTGMGLSVVHGVINGWNGRIKLESAPGKGAVFTVYLPILDYHIQTKDKAAEVNLKSVSAKVLVIDDEELLLKLYSVYMKPSGMEVFTFNDGEKALEEIQKDPAQYSLALVDKNLPGLGGEALALSLKEMNQDMKIILCSGYRETAEKEQLPESIDAFLMKPFSKKALLEEIHRLLGED